MTLLVSCTTVSRQDNDLDNLWPYFSEELNRRLSQRTQPSADSNLPSLHLLSFKPFAESIFIPHEALRLHETVYFHLCLTSCPDLEYYKTTIDGQLSNWMKAVLVRKNQRTVIFHVTSAASSISGDRGMPVRGRVLSRSDLVFEQLSTDYPEDGHHRLIQLQLRDHGEDNWRRALDTLKKLLVESFNDQVSGIEEDVRRLEAQRTLPGWNFCTFFIKKEAIALIYQEAQIWSKALGILDELSDLYELVSLDPNVASNQSLSWLNGSTLDPTDLSDNPDPLPIRARILRSETNPVQMALYIYNQRAVLLQNLGNHAELHAATLQIITKISFLRESTSETIMHHPWPLLTACKVLFDKEACASAGHTPERAALLVLVQTILKKLACLHSPQSIDDTEARPEPIPLVKLSTFDKSAWDKLLSDWQFYLSFYCQICELCLDEFESLKRRNHRAIFALDLAQALYLAGHFEQSLSALEKALRPGKAPVNFQIKSLLLRAKLLGLLGQGRGRLETLLNVWDLYKTANCITDKIAELFTMLELTEGGGETIEVGLERFFSIFNIYYEPHLNVIFLEIIWPYPQAITVSNLEMKLTGKTGDLLYACQEALIAPCGGTCRLALSATEGSVVDEGIYRLACLRFEMGSVHFISEYLRAAEKSVSFNISSGCSLSIENSSDYDLDMVAEGSRNRLKLTFQSGKHEIEAGRIETDFGAPIPSSLTWSCPDRDDIVVTNYGDAITIPTCQPSSQLIAFFDLCSGDPMYLGRTKSLSLAWRMQVKLAKGPVLVQERRKIDMPWDELWEKGEEWRRVSEGRMLKITRLSFVGKQPVEFNSKNGAQLIWPGQVIQKLDVINVDRLEVSITLP